MNLRHLSKVDSNPDITAWLRHIKGETIQPVAPLAEFIIDEQVIKVILKELVGRQWVNFGTDRDSQKAYLENLIAFWHFMGYDYLRFESGLSFASHSLAAQNTATGMQAERNWADEHRATINSLDELASFPFPNVASFDFFPFEYLDANLPEGMGLMLSHGGGFLENLTWMLSMEGLCINLYDQPDLVTALMERIGDLQMDFYRQIITLDHLVALFPGDDMGFRSGTFIKPDAMRQFILPWHKKLSTLAHQHGKLYFLHACGNLKKIMDDLIDDVKIDGRHSYEDAIMPVEDFYDIYGQRIAVLGGIDIDFLATSTPDAIRTRTRHHLEHCNRGRFAIGSGNSIPDYIPVENYLAMVDEGLYVRANH